MRDTTSLGSSWRLTNKQTTPHEEHGVGENPRRAHNEPMDWHPSMPFLASTVNYSLLLLLPWRELQRQSSPSSQGRLAQALASSSSSP